MGKSAAHPYGYNHRTYIGLRCCNHRQQLDNGLFRCTHKRGYSPRDQCRYVAEPHCHHLHTGTEFVAEYLVGTPALEHSFTEAGIELSENANIVVSSFDTTLTYEKLVIACDLIRNGADFYCTHPDYNCPTETGFIPDSGAIAALITASTNKLPKYFGKPHKETADMISELFGIPFEETAIVGDRLYTDIALGKNNGLMSVLVLSGETKIEDVNEDNAPDIILNGIGEIIEQL